MAAIDDIMGGSNGWIRAQGYGMSAIDSTLPGATTTVGIKPTTAKPNEGSGEQSKNNGEGQPETEETAAVAGRDATRYVGKPGEAADMTIDKPRSRMSYVELYQMLNPYRPETDEQREEREKREKREAMFSALGDGISALSNLFFTTRHAPNSYNPSTSMSAATKGRWERLRQEREAKEKAYADGYMRARAMDDAEEREERNWNHTMEREKIADARYEIKAAQDAALAELNENLKNQQISAAEYKAAQERIKADFAEKTEKLRQDYLRAGINQRNASAAASSAKAVHYNNGGGSGGGGKKAVATLKLEDGLHEYTSKEDYKRDVEAYAKEYNLQDATTYTLGEGYSAKKVVKPKKTHQLAAEVELEAKRRREGKKRQTSTKSEQPPKKNQQAAKKSGSAKSKFTIH